MIDRAMDLDRMTDDIVSRVRTAVRRPWRIVLFGSRARGDHRAESDYDIYVEASEEGVPLNELHARVRQALGRGASFDLKLNPPGEIERRRDDPGTIEWDVARQGRVLFADPAAPATLAPSMRVGEPPAGVPESVHEWLEVAKRDMDICLLLRREEPSYAPEICWYSHQTCEKHLKALLVSRRARPERTHDLSGLLAALREHGCALPGLDADCKVLAEHAITPRYPAGLRLKLDDADKALDAARRVVAAVRAELPQGLR